MASSRGAPIGVFLLQKCFSLGRNRRAYYQVITLVLTFIAYTAYHISRRPLAVVKNSLNKDCSREQPPPGLIITDQNRSSWCNWAPFDGNDANRLLGLLDSIYIFAYAGCMFVSGMLAERIDLRYYLSLGMVISGIFTYLFGMAYYMNIHSYTFFIVVQILGGAVQSSGWPGVVSCVGNWFGKSRRGLIFGIWNAHLYVGNILGAYVAGYFVTLNWGMSFISSSFIVAGVGFILFLFLVPHPEDVDCEEVAKEKQISATIRNDLPNKLHLNGTSTLGNITNYPNILTEQTKLTVVPIIPNFESAKSRHSKKEAISFLNALNIPGVVEFSLCLFFSKLVSSTILYWLPRYLDSTIGGGSQKSAYYSTAFDMGGILGGVLAGVLSDYTGSSAMTCIGFLGLATPMLFIYQAYGSACLSVNIILQLICGSLVNGPYALITTAVTAELGTHPTIQNSKALPTVAAIIDGTGSVGAAIGPLLAGIISEMSWAYVFYMMMLADFCALMALVRPALKELERLYSPNSPWHSFRALFNCARCKTKKGGYEKI